MRIELYRKVISLTAFTFLGICILLGTLLLGIRFGRENALDTISHVLEGEGTVEDLNAQRLAVDTTEHSFTAQGIILSHDSGSFIIQTGSGSERTVLLTPNTRIRVKGILRGPKDIETGGTVYVVGQPLPNGELKAKTVRVLKK
ncbi:MAG: hypothetical protein WCG83_03310 [Candidatus Peregrinibacteria bacterium]